MKLKISKRFVKDSEKITDKIIIWQGLSYERVAGV